MEAWIPRLRRLLLWSTALVFSLLIAGGAFFYWQLGHRFPPIPELSGQAVYGSLEAGGRTRSYLFYVPKGPLKDPALVLVLHGSMGTSEQARAAYGYGFEELADRQGAVVVYPQGYEGYWNDSRRIGPFAAKRENVDDVGFLRELVAEMARQHGVNTQRVFITGVSNGGQMALRIALEAPGLMRAYAPVVASMPREDNLACTPSGQPVSILFMNGDHDPVNPWEGGDVELWPVLGNRGPVLSARDSAAYFARLAGLETTAVVTDFPDVDPGDGSTVQREVWSAEGKKTVALCTVKGGGHGIPHPQMYGPRLLGPSNRDIDAAEIIWDFFRSAP